MLSRMRLRSSSVGRLQGSPAMRKLRGAEVRRQSQTDRGQEVSSFGFRVGRRSVSRNPKLETSVLSSTSISRCAVACGNSPGPACARRPPDLRIFPETRAAQPDFAVFPIDAFRNLCHIPRPQLSPLEKFNFTSTPPRPSRVETSRGIRVFPASESFRETFPDPVRGRGRPDRRVVPADVRQPPEYGRRGDPAFVGAAIAVWSMSGTSCGTTRRSMSCASR